MKHINFKSHEELHEYIAGEFNAYGVYEGGLNAMEAIEVLQEIFHTSNDSVLDRSDIMSKLEEHKEVILREMEISDQLAKTDLGEREITDYMNERHEIALKHFTDEIWSIYVRENDDTTIDDQTAILKERIMNIGYHSFGRKPVIWKAFNATAGTVDIELEILLEPEFENMRNRIENAATLSREAARNETTYMDEAYATEDPEAINKAQERARMMFEEYEDRIEYEVRKALIEFVTAYDSYTKIQKYLLG